MRVHVDMFVLATVDRTVNGYSTRVKYVEGHCLLWIDDCRQFLVTFRHLLAKASPYAMHCLTVNKRKKGRTWSAAFSYVYCYNPKCM